MAHVSVIAPKDCTFHVEFFIGLYCIFHIILKLNIKFEAKYDI